MPCGRSRNISSQVCFRRPTHSTSVQLLAPQMTASVASKRMASREWCYSWGRLGSSTSVSRETRGTGMAEMSGVPDKVKMVHPTRRNHWSNWRVIALMECPLHRTVPIGGDVHSMQILVWCHGAGTAMVSVRSVRMTNRTNFKPRRLTPQLQFGARRSRLQAGTW